MGCLLIYKKSGRHLGTYRRNTTSSSLFPTGDLWYCVAKSHQLFSKVCIEEKGEQYLQAIVIVKPARGAKIRCFWVVQLCNRSKPIDYALHCLNYQLHCVYVSYLHADGSLICKCDGLLLHGFISTFFYLLVDMYVPQACV